MGPDSTAIFGPGWGDLRAGIRQLRAETKSHRPRQTAAVRGRELRRPTVSFKPPSFRRKPEPSAFPRGGSGISESLDYKVRPWTLPFGPTFGRSNSFQTNLSGFRRDDGGGFGWDDGGRFLRPTRSEERRVGKE